MRPLSILLALCFTALAQPEYYNSVYRGTSSLFTREPNAFLVQSVQGRKPGRALDVGMGQGRNTIFLARQGWDVTGFDSAEEGVRRARVESARLGLRIQAETNTFEGFNFGENKWDLIVLTYEPTKTIAPKVVRALKPGGVVVVEDRHLDTRRTWPTGTFANNELLSLFPGLRVLRYEDLWARPDWSLNKLDERLVRLLAEKPLPKEPGCLWEGKTVNEGDYVCWETAILHCEPDGWKFTSEKCSR